MRNLTRKLAAHADKSVLKTHQSYTHFVRFRFALDDGARWIGKRLEDAAYQVACASEHLHTGLLWVAGRYRIAAVNLHLLTLRATVAAARAKATDASMIYSAFREWERKEQLKINAQRLALFKDANFSQESAAALAAEALEEARALGRKNIYDNR